MIDTAGTLCKAADVLLANGARRVFAFATHGLLSRPGNESEGNSGISEVVINNTLHSAAQKEAHEKADGAKRRTVSRTPSIFRIFQKLLTIQGHCLCICYVDPTLRRTLWCLW